MLRIATLLSLALIFFQSPAQTDSVTTLNELTISGNRIQSGFEETGASVILISKADIQRTPSISIADMLHNYAGIDIRQRGANGIQADVGIRGSTFDQVLILLNGIKISDLQTGHHSMNLPVDMESVERIEIIKGPAARVYGQNAFAGAINIITKTPKESYIKVGAMAGEYGLGGFRFSAAQGNKTARHYFAAGRDFSDGYRYNTQYEVNNYFYQSDITTRQGVFKVLSGYSGRAFGANGFYAGPTFKEQAESIETSLVSVEFTSAEKRNRSLSQRVYWRRNKDDYMFNRTTPTVFHNLHANNVIGYEINASFKHSLGLLGAGLDVNQLWLRSNNLGNHDRTVATLFIENKFTFLSHRLNVTPGFQLNYYSDYGVNFFPGVDLSLMVIPGISLFGNTGYTYRVPSYTNLYYRDPANLSNPNLKPEYAFSYEAGIKILNKQTVQVQGSYFNRDGQRIIDYQRNISTDPWYPVNQLDITMSGIDVDAHWKPADLPLSLNAGYTWIKAVKSSVEGQSKYALESLNYQFVAGLSIRYTKWLTHTLSYRYYDRISLPTYQIVDTRLFFQGNRLAGFLEATNLFDEAYTETTLVTLPGRWVKAGISYTFKRLD
jgi:iron complex outermembrane receptor protein